MAAKEKNVVTGTYDASKIDKLEGLEAFVSGLGCILGILTSVDCITVFLKF